MLCDGPKDKVVNIERKQGTDGLRGGVKKMALLGGAHHKVAYIPIQILNAYKRIVSLSNNKKS